MAYQSDRIIRLRQQLSTTQAALDKLYDTYSDLAGKMNNSYSFDSGEGGQRTTRLKPEDINNQIRELEAKESHLINELQGMGLVNIRLRRLQPYYRRNRQV